MYVRVLHHPVRGWGRRALRGRLEQTPWQLSAVEVCADPSPCDGPGHGRLEHKQPAGLTNSRRMAGLTSQHPTIGLTPARWTRRLTNSTIVMISNTPGRFNPIVLAKTATVEIAMTQRIQPVGMIGISPWLSMTDRGVAVMRKR